jgi:hypothetical protein
LPEKKVIVLKEWFSFLNDFLKFGLKIISYFAFLLFITIFYEHIQVNYRLIIVCASIQVLLFL